MEIAALVYNRKMDYNAVFRIYALYEYLKRQGNRVEIIDYMLLKNSKSQKNLMLYNFLNENIILTVNRYKTKKQIEDNLPLADKFIVANGKYDDLNLCLGENTIAYGATGINENEYFTLSPNYSKFSLSIKDASFGNLEQVIDLLYLLNKKEWKEIIDEKCKEELVEVPYVLIYGDKITKSMLKYANKLVNKTNKKVYVVAEKIDALIYRAKRLLGIEPFELLGLIKKADAVITNTNDGIIFSSFLEKKLHIFTNNDKEQVQNINILGVANRVVQNTNHVLSAESEYTSNNIYVDMAFEELRKKSYEFLK